MEILLRRRLSIPALILAAVLSLTACSSSSSAPSETSAAAGIGSEGPFPAATGEFGEKPELTFSDAAPSRDLQVKVLSEGDGDVVGSGDLLVANYLGQVWGGDAAFDNSYDSAAPAAFGIGVGSVVQGWDIGLVGQKVGSRVLLTIPSGLGYGEAGNEQAGITGTDTIVFVVDIVGTYAADAAGQADATPTAESASVVPQVTGALGAAASIAVPAGAASPVALTTTVLATGSGASVEAGQIVVQYAVTYWDNSDGQSTWTLGLPAAVDVGVGAAFDSLEGIPVGSRVLIELPATADTPAIAAAVDIVDQIGPVG